MSHARRILLTMMVFALVVVGFMVSTGPADADNIFVCVDGDWIGGIYQFCVMGTDNSCTECTVRCAP